MTSILIRFSGCSNVSVCVYFQFQLQNLSRNSMSKFGSNPSPCPSLITYNDPRKIPRAIEFFLSQLKIKDFIEYTEFILKTCNITDIVIKVNKMPLAVTCNQAVLIPFFFERQKGEDFFFPLPVTLPLSLVA